MSVVSHLRSAKPFTSGRFDDLSFSFSSLHVSPGPAYKSRFIVCDKKRSNGAQPIFKIPVELLCEIFAKFVDDETKPDYSDASGPLVSFNCRANPVVLGQVCSQWRDAALNMPSLWSTILISEPKRSQVKLTKLWLERSKSQPLSLTVTTDDTPEPDILAASYDILSLLASHLPRWHKAQFRLPMEMIQQLAQILKSSPKCGNLKSIDFDSFTGHLPVSVWEEASLTDIWSFLYLSPGLRQVTWYDSRAAMLPKNIPFGNLTHVKIDFFVTIGELFTILQQCSKVEEFHVENLESPLPQGDLSNSPIILPFLRSLLLKSAVTLAPLFSALSLPALETLSVLYRHGASSFIHADPLAMRDLLVQSRCKLRSLTLGDSDASDGLLEQHLTMPCFSQLTSFKFRGNVSDKIIDLLLQKDASEEPLIMPMLNRLYLNSCDADKIDDGKLFRLAVSRWSPPPGSPYPKAGALREFAFVPRTVFGPIDNSFLLRYASPW